MIKADSILSAFVLKKMLILCKEKSWVNKNNA